MTINTKNPISRVKSWYKDQLKNAEANELKESRKQYDAEIRKFNDAFESVAKLDNSKVDTNRKPGEVSVGATSSSLSSEKSLRKTDEGFALTVSSQVGLLGAAAAGAGGAFGAFGTGGVFDAVGLGPQHFGGHSPPKTFERTEYRVNESSGTISVIRDTTSANLRAPSRTSTEKFVLDTESQTARSQDSQTSEPHRAGSWSSRMNAVPSRDLNEYPKEAPGSDRGQVAAT